MINQSTIEATPVPAWLVREDPTRIAAFRIVLGLVLLADILHLYAFRGVFANPHRAAFPIGGLLLIWSGVLVAMIAGYCSRIATIANYLLCAFLIGFLAPRHGFSQTAADAVAVGLSLIAMILPCGSALSIDRAGSGSKPPTTIAASRWLLAAFLSSIYVDSAIHKILSPMWNSGAGATAPMTLPSLVWIPTDWLSFFPAPLLQLMTWGVIAFELFIPVLYAWRRTRILAVLTGIFLHLSIAIVYPIPAFSGVMIAIYAGLLPDPWYEPLRRLDLRLSRAQTRVPAIRLAFAQLPRVSPAAVIAIWLALIAAAYAPDLVRSEPAHKVFVSAARAVFAMTGVSSHEVFSHGLFMHYGYQLRLVPANASNGEAAVPYSRNNLLAWSVRDRVWEHWWKRAQAPWTPVSDASFLLVHWAEYYWQPTSGPMTLRIEARQQEVKLTQVDTDLFTRNQAEVWQPIGAIELRPGTPAAIAWNTPPHDNLEYLYEFVGRSLH